MKFVSVRAIAPVLWGLVALMTAVGCVESPAWAQSVSGVRGFNGGTAPLVRFPGGSLYIDNQGTQGFLYNPGQNFQTYSFRNPTTGQAWSGAVGTMGPQLSIGLIQGGNQSGNPLVLPGPPRQTAPLLPIQSTIPDFDDIP
ncbi:MAG: hypothetical protein HP491_17865 [Nitrospira sp.]|nr:hypothetical protein [Nitrospira sp.]MBH0183766.1 hypothetical protein [Nitrospira sp.]